MEKVVYDKSYGVIPVRRADGRWWFLLIHQNAGHWAFPKGHPEVSETEIETALRELKEETGVEDVTIEPDKNWSEHYVFQQDGQTFDKTVKYFLGTVGEPDVEILKTEIQDYKWLGYGEARELLTFENAKHMLDKAVLALGEL